MRADAEDGLDLCFYLGYISHILATACFLRAITGEQQ